MTNRRIINCKLTSDWQIINTNFLKLLNQNEDLSAFIFGAGNGGKLMLEVIQAFNNNYKCKINIKAFLDNDINFCYRVLLNQVIGKCISVSGSGESIQVYSKQNNRSVNISKVSVKMLHRELGFNQCINYPNSSFFKSLDQWKMEEDDAPIFKYTYRQFQPKRHLEFGTWQGQGVTYCLEESNATVWTINLPFGEKISSGQNAYGNYSYEVEELQSWADIIGLPKIELYNTDSIGFIGRKYLEKDMGNRVCQIYCDSTKWDISNYPKNFFDTVLIDGAHSKEVVISDTKKAFSLLSKGGIIMWHDFCPPIWEKFEVTRGVMEGIISQWDFIVENTSKLFWIEPSWILLGVKN